MAEHRVVFTLSNFAGDTEEQLEDLLARLRRVAPDCGPFVEGGPGPGTDVTLALDAADAVEALAHAAALVRHAFRGLGVGFWPVSVELVH